MPNSLASETKDCSPTRGCNLVQCFLFVVFADSCFRVEDITENDWMETVAVPFRAVTSPRTGLARTNPEESPGSGRSECFRLTRHRLLVQDTSKIVFVEASWT